MLRVLFKYWVDTDSKPVKKRSQQNLKLQALFTLKFARALTSVTAWVTSGVVNSHQHSPR